MENLNEHLEPLGNGIEIFVNNNHHFSTDTILLANFANVAKSKYAVDLGTGCGTIAFVWSRESKAPQKIVGVELQRDAYLLCEKSLKHNKLEDKMTFLHEDMCALKGKIEFGFYDLVACNPPYKEEGSGLRNPNEQKQNARHEITCSINDIAGAASKLLQFNGRFCVCQRPERLTDVLFAFRENKIEPKRLRFVQQRKAKAPKLFLLEGRKSGNLGNLVVEPTLFIEDENGNFSQEMLNIYGEYKV